jgi:50S ribosomal protein L16 3-hydroxylase
MTNRAGLSALISPYQAESFIKESWPHEPFVVHGLKETVAQLTDLPFLQSLDSLLNSWPGLVQAHLPDVSDESSSVDATPKDAKKLFANRLGLLFNNVQTISPELKIWLAALMRDLGLPKSTYARCIVYATPDGKGTAAHFDQNINFVLQLHGTKTWWLAPNGSVNNPTQRFTIGQPLDPELASYAYEEMPLEMPREGRREIILKPGSMLFVPRGFWHSTSATGEALALNFTFSQPTWIDLFTLALRSRLSLSPEWRELADGVNSTDQNRKSIAHHKLNDLLVELVDDLPNWKAEDVLGATEGDQ